MLIIITKFAHHATQTVIHVVVLAMAAHMRASCTDGKRRQHLNIHMDIQICIERQVTRHKRNIAEYSKRRRRQYLEQLQVRYLYWRTYATNHLTKKKFKHENFHVFQEISLCHKTDHWDTSNKLTLYVGVITAKHVRWQLSCHFATICSSADQLGANRKTGSLNNIFNAELWRKKVQ